MGVVVKQMDILGNFTHKLWVTLRCCFTGIKDGNEPERFQPPLVTNAFTEMAVIINMVSNIDSDFNHKVH